MDHDQFQLIAQLFEDARQLPIDQQVQFVGQRLGLETALRDEVLALLRHHQDEISADSLDQPGTPNFNVSAIRNSARDQADSTLAAGDGPIPERIGRYRILSRIAEGGMGIVYLAEQDQPHREVALKIIKPGMDSAAVVARFEQERQALAVLDHPGIAKVIDAGATERGLPYFVMEYVRGIPITEFCDSNRLGLDDRIRLLIAVCEAVQHAHAKGVIHRDLKPSNILVEVRDGLPTAKVIDFGIAKALNQRLTEGTIFTEHGQLIGTPEYMSPEQAEMSELDIDTRADVYSLGVVLYELLTGSLPFASDALRSSSFAEIQRIILEDDPPRPSTKVCESRASLRRLDSRTLQRLVRGDLDWIVMKCLEKDRDRRYHTANALAMDLNRHLRDEPVLASPPSTAYRVRKFARRNRAAVLAGLLIMATLLTATSVSAIYGLAEAEQRRIAQRESKRAEAQAMEAQRQGDIAQAVNAFIRNDLLSAIRPDRMGRDVQMMDVLDAAAERLDQAVSIDGRFADKPEIEADLRHTIGVAYRHLGNLDSALIHLERELELLRDVAGILDPRTLKALNSLGVLCEWMGRYEEAEAYTLEALEGRRLLFGDDHENTLNTLTNLGVILSSQGRMPEAERCHREALEGKIRTLGEEHPQTLISFNCVGTLLSHQMILDEAEEYLRNAVQLGERIQGEEHPETLNARNNLGLLLLKRGEIAEVEWHLIEVLKARRRVLGTSHPKTLLSVQGVSRLRQQQGRLTEALKLAHESLEEHRRAFGDRDVRTLNACSHLGAVFRDLGMLDESEQLTAEAVRGAREIMPPHHWHLATSLVQHARTLTAMQRFKDAEVAMQEARGHFESLLGPLHRRTISATENLAEMYDAWHEHDPYGGHDERANRWRELLAKSAP